ncbi:hypothetical protein BH23PLA1_BH23PLA1_35870 [soil metagenome]
MAEPRTRWGQIIVEKVEALDQRFEQLDQRFDTLDRRVEALDRRVEALAGEVSRQTNDLRALTDSQRDLFERSIEQDKSLSTVTATVRWSAGVITLTLPLLLTGAIWLTWYTASLGQRVENQAEAMVELRSEIKAARGDVERIRTEVETLRSDFRAGFDRIEAAIQAEPLERTE